MRHSFTLAMLASGACIAVAFAFVACQSSSDNPPTYTNGGSGGAGGANQGGSGQGGNGQGGGNQGGSGQGGGNQGGSGQGGSGQGGTGGSNTEGGSCFVGGDKTMQEIATGGLGKGIAVHFTAVAASGPILSYQAKPPKDSCLWALFVRDPNSNFATTVMSYGPPQKTDADGGSMGCDPNPVFDGIVAGDQLDVTGTTSPYAPSTCVADGYKDPTKAMQVMVDFKCPEHIKKTGSGTVPAAVQVTDIDGLATGKVDYQGAWVEISNVDALDWADGGGPVGSYGIIKIKGTNETLEIHDKFYYLTDGGPQYGPGTHFNKITGFLYLDYCTWALMPMHKCTDMDPKSSDCP